MKNFKSISIAILFIAFLGSITTSCEKCDDCDEPGQTPTPTPTDTISQNDLIIVPTNLITYGYEEYNDVCIMIIKSAFNNPTISVTPVHDYVSTYVKKLSENPDDDGFYNYLVYANISQNTTENNRPFKITAKATIYSSTNADSFSNTLNLTCTQQPKQQYENEHSPFKLSIGKWVLRNVGIINNNTGDYTYNSYLDNSLFLNLPGEITTLKLTYLDEEGNPVEEMNTQCVSESYTCSNLNECGFIIPNGNGLWYAELNEANDGYLCISTNNQSYQMKMIMISSSVMALEYTEDNTIYSYYFNKASQE